MVLHDAQNKIARDLHRFRVLNCGRRFGKTSLAIEEIKGKAVAKPARIAYIAPTYQQARDIAWELLKRELRPVALAINEARLEIRVQTLAGGESVIILRGWESIETLRGQQFDFVVIDEVAMMRNFWINWTSVISPTLTDTKGDALFISTPKGFNHFYDLYNLQETDPDFRSFHFTTFDNPHIPVEEIERQRRSLPEDTFAQEFLADFRKQEGLVYKEFNRARHVYTDTDETLVEKIAGVDFGFVHPAAVLTIWRDRSDGFWVTEEFYETGRTDIEVAEYVAGLEPSRVYPDPESPSAIEELRRRNLNIRPVVKGKDSEKNGIDKVRELLKANKLHIHRSCKNLIGEFETHAYKDGKDVPEDEGEDALDALRYPIMMLMAEPSVVRDEPHVEEPALYPDIGV